MSALLGSTGRPLFSSLPATTVFQDSPSAVHWLPLKCSRVRAHAAHPRPLLSPSPSPLRLPWRRSLISSRPTADACSSPLLSPPRHSRIHSSPPPRPPSSSRSAVASSPRPHTSSLHGGTACNRPSPLLDRVHVLGGAPAPGGGHARDVPVARLEAPPVKVMESRKGSSSSSPADYEYYIHYTEFNSAKSSLRGTWC
ncbi:hypothetical protein PVAP13_8KG161602 [Panicum virgatum]|uniref:Tudor-knot domain-containing protein n=1 Tax=Panicum virgatum TaxID=38727 RepID=A0A8T0PH62_PANVG|nr:hypothetical protein PVAP13_8KG161602 [Panicum virgatum]